MPKYQIILSSDQQIPDDEFEDTIKRWFFKRSWAPNKDDFPDYIKFEVIEARNLEGIREELWKTKEEIKMDLCNVGTVKDNNKELNDKMIEESFNEISKLFKLDS